jgi:amphi-Trp domain-containing protein
VGDSRSFEFDGPAASADVADLITRIAKGVRAQAISLSLGDEPEIVLRPGGELSLEVLAKTKKDGGKLEVVIAWKRLENDPAEEATDDATHESPVGGASEVVPATGSEMAGTTKGRRRWGTARGSSSKAPRPRPKPRKF